MECTRRSCVRLAVIDYCTALRCLTDEVQGNEPQVSCSIFTLNFQHAKKVV